MGIFKRINDITLASINEMLDKLENPISMIKQYIRELEEKIAEAKLALSSQLLAERKYEVIIAEMEQVVQKRLRQANLAIDRSDEEIAQLALEEKLASERRLQTYREQYDTVQRQTSALQEQLMNLKELYDELQNKKLFLMSRASAARAIQNANTTLYSFDADKVRQGFTRMEEQIWHLEAKAAAALQVNQMFQSPSTAAADLAFKADVQQELERLKEARKTNVAG